MDVEEFNEKMDAIREYLEIKIDHKLTDKQWGVISYKAYEDGHAGGYDEVVAEATDLGDFVIELLQDDFDQTYRNKMWISVKK